MLIPHTKLNPETLRAIIEEYITREGTDYGDYDFDMNKMVLQVIKQLENGKAVITFDEDEGSCSIQTS